MWPSGIFFGVPALPASYVPRPDAIEPVLEQLSARPASGLEAPGLSAIHGPDGLGKTTLAAALSREPELHRALPDGVLWATLGRQPTLLRLLTGWIEALRRQGWPPTTDASSRFVPPTSVRAASAHLRELLADRALLLVLDDAQSVEHVRPFLVGGPRCRTLLTTPQVVLVDTLRAYRHEIAVLRPAQAQALLERWLGRELAGSEREQALEVAAAAGYLPHALELAVALVAAHPVPWTEMLIALRREVAQVEVLEDPLDRHTGGPRFTAIVRLSLRALQEQDERAWRAFCWLGVLPEEAMLAVPVATTLWEVDTGTAGALLERLRGYALLQPSAESPPAGPGTTYRMHNLLHDLARRLLEAPQTPEHRELPGLGISLPVAHAQLLARYRRQAADGRWHSVPDDGHLYTHLVWHLEQAGAAGEIDALLREETAGGQLGWYLARDRRGQTAGYLQDVARAWELADAAGAAVVGTGTERAAALGRIVGQQVRYALLAASISSLIRILPPMALVTLVQRQQLTPAQGLFYARTIGGIGVRAATLGALAQSLGVGERKSVLREALIIALTIHAAPYRIEVLGSLWSQLEGEERQAALQGMLAVARTIGADRRGAEALIAVAPSLGTEERWAVLQEALAIARILSDDAKRMWTLKALIPLVDARERRAIVQAALVAALAIVGVRERVLALTALAPLLPLDLLPAALLAAAAIEEEWGRSRALIALTAVLPGELLPEALAAARTIGNREMRAEALMALVPLLDAEGRRAVLQEALAAAGAIGDGLERTRTRALMALAPLLEAEERHALLQEALATAQAIHFGRWRVETLLALAPLLDEEVRHAALIVALAAVPTIFDDLDGTWARAEVLGTLALHLPSELFPKALAIARAIRAQGARAAALGALAPHVPPELLPKALAIARAIRAQGARAAALTALMPLLIVEERRAVLQEALAAARAIGNGKERERALEKVVPLLGTEERRAVLQEALAAAQAVDDRKERVWALGALAPLLGAEKRRLVLQEALDITRAIDDRRSQWQAVGYHGYEGRDVARAEALSALVPHLPSELLPETLATVRSISDARARAAALSALAPHLSSELLPKAIAAARAIRYKEAQVTALGALAPRLGAEERQALLQEALIAARAIRDSEARARALVALAPHLSAELLSKALASIRAIGYAKARDDVLGALVPLLPAELLPQALVAVRAIGDEQLRVQALGDLAPRLPAELLPEALAVAWAMAGARERVVALAALAPLLQAEERHALLQEALAAAQALDDGLARTRTRVLMALAPLLETDERRAILQEALVGARVIRDAWLRAEALGASVPLLGAEECYMVLQEALASIRTIEDLSVSARADALGGLRRQLEQVSAENLYPLWCQLLHALVGHTREMFLADLGTLIPLLQLLGGPVAAAAVARAIGGRGPLVSVIWLGCVQAAGGARFRPPRC